MHRIIAEVHLVAKPILSPELHSLITVLVGEDINYIRKLCLLSLLSFAALQGKQAQASQKQTKPIYHFILIKLR
jgi:hypothetical protein